MRLKSLLRPILPLFVLHATGCLLGLGLLVAAFRLGILGGIDILFYRGLVLIVLAALLTFAILGAVLHRLRLPRVSTRDAFAAAILSLSLNLSFFVVVPVTVDRSISIFLLGEMAERPQQALTPDAASTLFKTVYVDEYREIDRRLREQALSGNLEKIGDGYRISRRGLFVVEMAKVTAWMFDSRTDLAAPRNPWRVDRALLPEGLRVVRHGP